MDELLVERVLRAVECIPARQVTSYGQIADLVGTGPRQVGAIMNAWGSSVPWWRVTNAQGRLPAQILTRAREQWIAEGTPLRDDQTGCAMRIARVDLEDFTRAVRAATADLDGQAPGPATRG